MGEHVFTDDEIRQIIDVINRTKHTQYIGARYVPMFGRVNEDSIEWDNSAPYEPLTIVLYQGNSYTSRQYVPTGIEITNEQYWANTGNYNAQVEQYRQEVKAFDARITANTQSSKSANDKLSAIGVNTVQDGTELLERIESINTGMNQNTEAITRLETAKQDKDTRDIMLVFGDSMTVKASAQAKQYWAILADKLGVTARNYGVGGAGFSPVTGTTTYDNELTTAINDTGYDKTKVRYIVISASTNDQFANSSTIEQKANSMFDRVATAWPDADVYVLGGLNGTWIRYLTNNAQNKGDYDKYVTNIATVCQAASRHFFHVIPESYTWLLYRESLTSTDGLHPNDAGFEVIAANLYDAMTSGGDARRWSSITEAGATKFLTLKEYTIENSDDSELTFSADKGGPWNVFQPDPVAGVCHFSLNQYGLENLSSATIQKFAINVQGSNKYGLDIPIAKKLLAFPTIHHLDQPWVCRNIILTINGYQITGNYWLYVKSSDSRLANPESASQYIWLMVDSAQAYIQGDTSHGLHQLDFATLTRDGNTIHVSGEYDLSMGVTRVTNIS